MILILEKIRNLTKLSFCVPRHWELLYIKTMLLALDFCITQNNRQTKRTFVFKKDRFGNSALHFAALKGNAGIVKTLLEVISRTGSEINSRNRIGQTPAAIALQEGHISLVELFKKTSKVDFDTKVSKNCK